MVAQVVSSLFHLLQMLILIWCALSWFPNIRWYDQPFKTLDQIIQPVVMPFRRFIPPVGGFDFSPIFAMIALQLGETVIVSFLR